MLGDLPWEAWALILSTLLGSGGAASLWAQRRDRAEKAAAKAEGAPVAAADRVALLLTRMEEVSDKATTALERAVSAEEIADVAARQARSAVHRAEQAESDVAGLVGYMREMWVGITTSTVPPHPPIPHHIRHIISDRDFPLPPTPTREESP